jgi:hypothetical protein
LFMIFKELKENNMIPSWIHLYLECIGFGMKHNRIISEIRENMITIYPDDFINVVIKRLEDLEQ